MPSPPPPPGDHALAELLSPLTGKTYYVLRMEPTDTWHRHSSDDIRDHLRWATQLEKNGGLLLGGPLDWGTWPDPSTWSGSALWILRAASRQEAEEIARAEPLHRAGYRENTVQKWRANGGSLRISVKLLNQEWSLD